MPAENEGVSGEQGLQEGQSGWQSQCEEGASRRRQRDWQGSGPEGEPPPVLGCPGAGQGSRAGLL